MSQALPFAARTRVEVRQVELFALWPPPHRVARSPAALPDIWGEQATVGLWSTVHLAWQPAQPGSESSWLTLDEAIQGLAAMRAHLATLIASGDVSSTLAADKGLSGAHDATSHRPAYAIVYVNAIRSVTSPPIQRRLGSIRPKRRRVLRPVLPRKLAQWAQEIALSQMLIGLGVAGVDPRTGWAPSYFSHFDRSAQERGWIIVAPELAIVAGASADEVDALASLIQPRDVDTAAGSGQGILPERYESLLSRITAWNGTQDVFEAVMQLEALVTEGRRSTDGQVWLNFALAGIGVLLAIFAGPHLAGEQTAALLLLAVASIFHAQYARSGRWRYQVVGWTFWVAAIVVALVSLLPASSIASLLQWLVSLFNVSP